MKKQQPIHGALRARTRAPFFCTVMLMLLSVMPLAARDQTRFITMEIYPAEAVSEGCTATAAFVSATASRDKFDLTATPGSGWVFVRWMWEGIYVNTMRNPYSNCTFSESTTVKAYFARTSTPTYSLSLAVYNGDYGLAYWTKDNVGSQTGKYGRIGTGFSVDNGTGSQATNRGVFYDGELNLIQTDQFSCEIGSAGSKFVKWSNGVKDLEQLITVASDNREFIAYYVANDAPERTITINTSGSGTATGDGDYYDNCPAFLTATPDDGATFDHWENGSGVNISTDNPYKFTVSGNATYTAVFTGGSIPTPTYTITWVDGNGDEIYHETVTEGDVPAFDDRTTPTKTQTAQYTYTFNNTWSPTPYAADKDQTYTAQFNQTTRQYTITVTSAGHGTVTGGGTYDYGTSVPLTATPDTYYNFGSWTDAGAQNHNVTVTGTASYTASFTLNTSSTLEINDNENTTYYSTILAAYNGTPMDISIMRKFFAGMWNTVCFPFDLTAAQRSSSGMSAATFYTLSSVTGDAAEGLDFNVTAITTETMTARTPYLVQFTGADINNPTFTGVTLDANAFTNNTTGQSVGETKFFGTVHPTSLINSMADANEESGFLFLGQNNNLYWPNVVNDIRAFRAYFYSGNNAVQAIHPRVRIVLQNETTTGIEEIGVPGESGTSGVSGESGKSGLSGASVKKYLRNGSLIIERDGIRYNAVGEQIK